MCLHVRIWYHGLPHWLAIISSTNVAADKNIHNKFIFLLYCCFHVTLCPSTHQPEKLFLSCKCRGKILTCYCYANRILLQINLSTQLNVFLAVMKKLGLLWMTRKIQKIYSPRQSSPKIEQLLAIRNRKNTNNCSLQYMENKTQYYSEYEPIRRSIHTPLKIVVITNHIQYTDVH